jgi:phosphatidylglycerophosphate synthase
VNPWEPATAIDLATPKACTPPAGGEGPHNTRHPISRWYLLPFLDHLAGALQGRAIRPWQITLLGLGLTMSGCAILVWGPDVRMAAPLVLLAWMCDRLDGKLARRQQSTTPAGAWLDAQVDELGDILWHLASAAAVVQAEGTSWPWIAAAGLVAGKFLLLQGIGQGRQVKERSFRYAQGELRSAAGRGRSHKGAAPVDELMAPSATAAAGTFRARAVPWMRRLYHLPGNADVRCHLLLLAVALDGLAVELLLVGAYYNVRWLVRLVRGVGAAARRSAGDRLLAEGGRR